VETWFHFIIISLDERHHCEMSSFGESKAERVMNNKNTTAKFIQYNKKANDIVFDVMWCCVVQVQYATIE